MTSRPSLGVSQRQPQRSLSGSGLSQRPVPQRTLSQQYLPQSPIRRPESYNEQISDVGDASQTRFATAPRRGGSKLKLELANDGIDHAGFSESPQNLDPLSASRVFSPLRMMPTTEMSDVSDMIPQALRGNTVDGDSAPLPMPPRRARFVVPASRPEQECTSSNTPAAGAKKDTRPKPFTLEAPSVAPRYSNMGKQQEPPSKAIARTDARSTCAYLNLGFADFYPWSGGHPEDQFSDTIIRHGFFDKGTVQASQEAASARVPLLPALKHKSGLHTLSTVFTTILNQRRHSGQITSASTFKPPPRVTLTDTKREVWLKDLANPSISLRRLSRTIPHGIRGRILLDQCLNKNVPTDRAVWLAKCVGANEIRAFKRKGVNGTFVMGGETKWIRDWTVNVEQFVETVSNGFGDDDWKAKVTYAIRLATHLYAEHLVDRDHYMDWSLRATLLRRASYSVEEEASDVAAAIRHIKRALSIPLEADDPILQKKPMGIRKLAQRIGLSSRALQSEVGFWLSNAFATVVDANLQSSKDGLELSSIRFESARTLLEAAQDFTMLEQFLRAVSQCSNADILGQCADTISLHLPVFAATGAAKSLFHVLYDRLKVLGEEQGLGVRPLLASLANLAPRLPGFKDITSQLRSDLVRTDRSNAADASSPLSDNMAFQLQDAETELSEQIEKLASYTSADRPTMERLFHPIIQRIESCWNKADERQRAYCMLLVRLRVFDPQFFDTMMGGWVQHIRKLTNRPPIIQVLPLLISFGCLSLAIVFATATRTQPQANQLQPNAVGFASIYTQEILQMLMMPLTPTQVMTSEDCYKFRIVQERARLEHAKEVMPLIRGALAEYSASRNQQTPIPQPLDDEKTRAQLLELLRDLVLVDSNAACQTLSLKGPDHKLAALIETLTTELLVPHGGGGQKSFEQVLELANEFTLPFCQVKLSLNLAMDDASGPEEAERLQSRLESLSKAMDNAIDANNVMWTGMLSRLTPEITQHLKIRAESRFLDLLPSLKNQPATEDATNGTFHMAENLLTVIDSIVRGNTTPKASPFSHTMVDKVADIWEILASTNNEHAALKADVLSRWLPLLLSYLALLASTSTASAADTTNKASGGEIRGRALLVLAGLVQELDNHVPTSGPDHNRLGERAFDIALVLADSLPEDARQQCARAVRDATSDPRLRYLFSFDYHSGPAEGLMLAQRERPPQTAQERRALAANMAMMGLGAGAVGMVPERLSPFQFRRWEILSEPTPNVGENDTSLSLALFDARKI
ncbi:hypothetical protein DL769_006487 [Monosporascus sp. CRB-8-3]|nr:hypothetical protein DL769_006487 [Monosporascus sp. CRB-8-3]